MQPRAPGRCRGHWAEGRQRSGQFVSRALGTSQHARAGWAGFARKQENGVRQNHGTQRLLASDELGTVLVFEDVCRERIRRMKCAGGILDQHKLPTPRLRGPEGVSVLRWVGARARSVAGSVPGTLLPRCGRGPGVGPEPRFWALAIPRRSVHTARTGSSWRDAAR